MSTLVRVDLYKDTGKWKYGGEVRIDVPSHDNTVLEDIIEHQEIVTCCRDYYMVVSDLPESMNDRNYNQFYQRLYTVDQVNKALSSVRDTHILTKK